MMLLLTFVCLLVASAASKSAPIRIFGAVYSVLSIAHQLMFDGGTAAYAFSAMSVPLCGILILLTLSVKYQTKWQLMPLSIIMFSSIVHSYFGIIVYTSGADVGILNELGFLVYAAVIAGLLWSHNIGELVRMGGSNNIRCSSSIWRLAGLNAGDK